MQTEQWYWVEIRWQSTSGNPLTTQDSILASGADAAYIELHDRVKKKKHCMKIHGGDAHLMNVQSEDYFTTSTPAL